MEHTNESQYPPSNDRRLSIWIAALVPVIVLAGFARTYYLKGFFGNPPLPGLLVHLHGLVWGTLLIIASQPLRLMLAGTDVWMRFATAVVGLVG